MIFLRMKIGVVVPYRAQSRLIRSILRRTIGDETIWSRVVVDTVERMQGQEREVVLVSFATGSPAFAAQMGRFSLSTSTPECSRYPPTYQTHTGRQSSYAGRRPV